MKITTVLACLGVFLFAADATAKCGPGRSKYTKPAKPVTITLRGPDLTAPAFYWRDDSRWIVMYFSPDDLVSYLEQEEKDARANNLEAAQYPTRLRELFNAIKADLPLEDRTDLFKYVLKNTDIHGVLQNVIADLIKEGKVTVDHRIFRGDSNDPNALDDPTAIEMVSSLGESGEEAARYFCTVGDNPLFSIGYIIYD
jgi:hypothetical protein